MRYRAFISYSHKDARWARWVRRNLEGYRTPARLRGSVGEFGPLPDRLQPIFRDRDDLASAGSLSPKIEAALADSEALIVICSPNAARSPWVNGEVLLFKRMGRANRVYCLIVAGEPDAGDASECFAPALRFELGADGEPGTQRAEPIAADVRPGTDGKPLARMKLLSGLLGVDLNTLRRREAARRQRRLFAIAMLSVLAMLVTSFLAVQAVIARHAAERRQKQAEALVGFMLGNLSEKLAQVSRLDIMESVNDQAMAYFQSLPTTDVTEQSLEQRVSALVKIGNVRRDQGHLPEALQSYQAADTLSAQLARAAPSHLERQLAHARILSYIGITHWYQGQLDDAESAFKAVQAALLQARPLAPANAELLYQLSSVDNNFGHVLEGRGRNDEALAQYRSMLTLAQELVQVDASNHEWVSQSGLAHNNLAKMALLGGDLATAVTEYEADLEIQTSLARRDPQDNDQAEKVLLSRAALGRTQALSGDVESGISNLRKALDEVARLLVIAADNSSFLEDEGLYSVQLARWLRTTADPVGASALAAHGIALFERLTQQDPANTGWQRALATARIEQAQQARDAGRGDLAREHARAALAVLEPQLRERQQDRETVLATLAAQLLLADVTDADTALRLRNQAVQTAQAQSSARHDPRLLALQIEALLALGRKPDAQSVLSTLWDTGLRDPRFIALMRQERMPIPAAPAGKPVPP
ncbi:MAG: TIR domain-containing protein [Dokdonella sp.]